MSSGRSLLLLLLALAALLAWSSSAAVAASREDWERGKAFYTERCIFCHGKEGKGWSLQSRIPRPPMPVPDLTDPAFMRQFPDKGLFQVIKEGGTRLGKSRFMPPAGRWLSDADIRDVIVYLRSLERRPASGKK
ncbi:MAG: cytochrome c [bacterium]